MKKESDRAVALLREQLRSAWETMEGTFQDVSPEIAQWIPPGTALPIGAAYAHVVLSTDEVVNRMVRGERPLHAGAFAGKTGLSELGPGMDPSVAPPASPEEWSRAFAEWSRRVRIDLAALRGYGAAVTEATDGWLATLSEEELERTVDLSAEGMGIVTLAFVLNNVVIGHTFCHTGEISAIKGVRGLKGYPF